MMMLLRGLLLSALVAVGLGCQGRDLGHGDAPCMGSGPAPDEGVEDKDLVHRIEEEARRLIEAKLATPGQELRAQLTRTSVRLARPEPSAEALAVRDLYAAKRPGVLVVAGVYNCGKCSRWHSSSATGFAVTADGVIATNYHVVEGKDRETFVVYVDGGGVYPVREVLAASRRNDLALLRIGLPEGKKLLALPIAASSPVGTSVAVISHPEHRYFTLTQGIISRHFTLRRHGEPAPALAITADFAKGSSGAPVLDPTGAVVGIVTSTHSIYYDVKEGVQKNLQMVVKQCVPSSCLLELITRE